MEIRLVLFGVLMFYNSHILTRSVSGQSGVMLPEGRTERTTVCANVALQASCVGREVIAVQSVNYGTKLTTTCVLNANSTACCTYGGADCFKPTYSGTAQQIDCSGKSLCTGVTIAQEDTSSCGGTYPILNHYVTMQYYCIPASRILTMSASKPLTATGSLVYIQNQGYPNKISDTSGSCSVEVQDCSSQIKVYLVHFQLGDGGGSCTAGKQQLQINDNGTVQTLTCSNNTDFEITLQLTSTTNYITVTLENSGGVNDGYFWLGFEATNIATELKLDCPAKPQTMCMDCSTPALTGYSFNYKFTTYGAIANVTCATGYQGTPTSKNVKCRDTGQWETVAGCTIKNCSTPIQTGYSFNYNFTTYGAIANVTCATGYQGTPTSKSVKCQHTGQWETADGCTIKNCSTPIRTGYFFSYNFTTYGAIASVTCATGYQGTPTSKSVKCRDTGKWETVDGCTIKNCSTSARTGYSFNFNSTTYGAIANVTCATGYQGTPTSKSVKCQNTGQWETVDGCTIKDCSTPTRTGYSFNYNYTTYGAITNVTCATGYQGTPISKSVKCQNTGQWETVDGCTMKNCSTPTRTGYSFNYNYTTYGAIANVTCATGYQGTPTSKSVKCQNTGQWETVDGCTIKNCSTPTRTGYSFNYNFTTYGAIANVTCATGYQGTPTSKSVKCQNTVQWETVDGCTIKNCSTPARTGYSFNFNSTTYGAIANVTCATGYQGTPTSKSVKCQNTGQWETVDGCTIKNCSTPTRRGYSFNYNFTTYGAIANVTCATGYQGTPTSKSVKCQNTGKWETVDGCTIKNCSTPTRTGYSFNYNFTTYGAIANVTCATGYQRTPTSKSVKCQNTGQWETVDGCTIKNCSTPTRTGYYFNYNFTTYGAIANVTCATGYQGTPTSKSVKCQNTGQWETVDGCTIKNCSSPLKTGYFYNYTSSAYGAIAIVTCATGYHGTPPHTRVKCRDTGQWETVSGCTIKNCSTPIKTCYSYNYTATTYGATASVKCATGCQGKATSTSVKCQDNGQWTAVSGCNALDCSTPVRTGYSYNNTATTYDAIASVTCATGYYGTPTPMSVKCQDTGLWEMVTGCNIKNCSIPSKKGYLYNYTITTYQANAKVKCATGYQGTPTSASVKCQETGQWESVSGCTIKNCSLPAKTGYSYNYTTTIYQATAKVKCATGYQGTPTSTTVKCQDTGQWESVSGCNLITSKTTSTKITSTMTTISSQQATVTTVVTKPMTKPTTKPTTDIVTFIKTSKPLTSTTEVTTMRTDNDNSHRLTIILIIVAAVIAVLIVAIVTIIVVRIRKFRNPLMNGSDLQKGVHNVKVHPITDQNINGLHPELRPNDHQYHIEFMNARRNYSNDFDAGETTKHMEVPLQDLDININGLHTSLRAKDKIFYVKHPNLKQRGSELYMGPTDMRNGETVHMRKAGFGDTHSNKYDTGLPRSNNNIHRTTIVDKMARSDNDNVRNERIEQYLNGLLDYRNSETAFQTTNNATL